jgi:hypothetical protein
VVKSAWFRRLESRLNPQTFLSDIPVPNFRTQPAPTFNHSRQISPARNFQIFCVAEFSVDPKERVTNF